MKGSAKVKVPNGKIVEVKLDFDGSINSIQILGDFFMYPESALKELESVLVGVSSSESEKNLTWIILETLKRNNATAIGVTPDAIANVIRKAIGDEVESNKA